MQKWYLTNLGGTAQALGKVKVVNLPGTMLLYGSASLHFALALHTIYGRRYDEENLRPTVLAFNG